MANEIKSIKINGTDHFIDYPSMINRTFGVENREVWISEKTINFTEDDGMYISPLFPTNSDLLDVNDVFYLTFDGEEAEGKWDYLEQTFVFEALDSTISLYMNLNSYQFVTDNSSSTHTIKLERKISSKLPGKYISGYESIQKISGGTLTFTAMTGDPPTYTNSELTYDTNAIDFNSIAKITFDGVTYERPLMYNSEQGYCRFSTIDEERTCGFMCTFAEGTIGFMTPQSGNTHTVEIELFTTKYISDNSLPAIFVDNQKYNLIDALNMVSDAVNAGVVFSSSASASPEPTPN